MEKIKSLWNYAKGQVTSAPIPFGLGLVVGFIVASLF